MTEVACFCGCCYSFDGDAGASYLALRQGMIGIESDLSRQVESDGKSSYAVLEEVAVARVRVRRRPEAGVLTHGPEAAAVA